MTEVVTYVEYSNKGPGDILGPLPFSYRTDEEGAPQVDVVADGVVEDASLYEWTGDAQITLGASFPDSDRVLVQRRTPIDAVEDQQDGSTALDFELINENFDKTFKSLEEHRDLLSVSMKTNADVTIAEGFTPIMGPDGRYEQGFSGEDISSAQMYAEAAQAAATIANSAFYIVRNYSNNGTDDDLKFAVDLAYDNGGGVVFDHAITRDMQSKVTIPSGVTIQGSGRDVTIYKAKAGLDDDVFDTEGTSTLWAGDSADGAQYWGIRDCSIDGNKANNSAGNGLRSYSRCFEVRNVKVTYCSEAGMAFKWASAAAGYDDDDDIGFDPFMEGFIENVFSGYNDHEGLYFNGSHDSRISNVLCALNSHSVSNLFDGIYLGPRAGGTMLTQCHSWGETQRYAYNIEAASTHFANCEADDGYVALVMINAPDCTWVGGTQIGGFYHSPPTSLDYGLKGFVFGTSAYRPYIVANVRNCPKGMIDFTNVGNIGGTVIVQGALDAALQTAATGQTTYGFQGTVPSSFLAHVYSEGVGNNAALMHFPAGIPVNFADGSAAFPGLSFGNSITTGMFRASNKLGFSVGGTEVFTLGPDYCASPRRASTPATAWFEGMRYYDTTLHKERVFNGTAWIDL
jgi:hypothetical protein